MDGPDRFTIGRKASAFLASDEVVKRNNSRTPSMQMLAGPCPTHFSIAVRNMVWVVDKFPVKEFVPDQWHDYRVLVEGNHHRHWIDGHPTADLIDLDEQGRALVGVLAVQVHVGPAMKIQYKEFKIKHRPKDIPLRSADDHPIPAEACGVKPQGKLPTGWKAPVYSERSDASEVVE